MEVGTDIAGSTRANATAVVSLTNQAERMAAANRRTTSGTTDNDDTVQVENPMLPTDEEDEGLE
eukprot:COSAG06_NODE_45656_length_353_cov_0.610236_2_plen_63_part_01